MKKVTFLSLLLIISILISSCSSKVSNEINANEKPFSTGNIEKTIPNSYEELDKLPQKYTPEIARKNDDVVTVHGESYNVEKLDKFIDRFENKKANTPDMIRITMYTTEGDAIIHDLIASIESIKLIEDNTRDKFSSPENRKKIEYRLVDIFKRTNSSGISYIVKTDKGEELLAFVNNK